MDNTYKNAHSNLRYVCLSNEDHGYFTSTWNLLSKGHGCPKCAGNYLLTLEKIKTRLKDINPNIEILSSEYKNAKSKLECKCLKCEEHKNFLANWDSLSQGKGCPACGGRQKLTLNEIKNQLKTINPNVEITSKTYTNSNSKLKCKCLISEKHPIFMATWDSLRAGHGCPTCNSSKGEAKIRRWLDSYSFNYIQEYSFDNCRGKRGGLLRFDFYLSDINTCIEYDGEGHYNPFRYSRNKDKMRNKLKETRHNDSTKDEYCKDNNIQLLRIPYWEFDNIKQILENKIIGAYYERYTPQNLGSEDAYYEMCLPEECGYNEYDHECNYKTYEPESKQKYKLNRYYKKQIDKYKLDKLVNVNWWSVSTRKPYKRRVYYSGRKGTIKRISNKKVRKYKGDIADGAGYRKIYDYWYELF